MRTKNLTDDERDSIALLLMANSTKGKAHKGIVERASQRWAASTRCVRRVWVETKKQLAAGNYLSLVTKKKGKCGRQKKEFNREMISNIPMPLRGTIRSIGHNFSVSKSTAARWVQKGNLRAHTNAIKSELTVVNMIESLKFVLNALEVTADHSSVMFKELNLVVHIDEKWFNITKSSQRYYLLSGETPPHRTCKSKRYITKIMFMCAVARPIFGPDNTVLFDGKIGIFSFTEQEPAKRSGKNRPAGVMVTKPIDNINQTVIRDCIINKIIPVIKSKWPESSSKNTVIQQDNARPHLHIDDAEFMATANSGGFNISLTCQPLNSPDLNVLDLGFFRAIQSLQIKSSSKSVDDLVRVVEEAYDTLSADALDKVFITLQACMIEIMKRRGQNDYAVPHMGKDRLARLGLLKRLLVVEDSLIMECLDHPMYVGGAGQLDDLFNHMMSVEENQ